jgi:aspartate aminotransferase
LLVLNSPSNPTGVAYTQDELAAIGAVLRQHPQVVIASDDMYEHILWNHTPFVNILNTCPDLYDRTVVINGVSKAYAMTGWRIGYAAGPAELITAMTTVQSQCTSNPTSISQVAAQVALSSDQQCIKEMVQAFKERHDMAVAMLNHIPGFHCLPADGSFYLFPHIAQACQQKLGHSDDIQFAELLLNELGVAVVPGSAFGAAGYIRISIALDTQLLKTALEKIANLMMS